MFHKHDMSDNKTFNVAYCFDMKYLKPFQVSALSLLFHLPKDRRVSIFCVICGDDFSRARLRKSLNGFDMIARTILSNLTFSIIDCAIELPHTPVASYISSSTQVRLLLPHLLPADAHTVLYMDCDTLCIQDISSIFDIPFCTLAACNSVDNFMEDPLWNFQHVFAGTSSFNAGILLLDLEAMRQQDFLLKWIPIVNEAGLNDQSVLNLYMQGQHTQLPGCWNTFPSVGSPVPGDAMILHWSSSVKPWQVPFCVACPAMALWRQMCQKLHMLQKTTRTTTFHL